MKLLGNWQRNVAQNWQKASSDDESFKLVFVINIAICAFVYMSIMHWLKFNSGRHGMIIDDPLYNLLAPHDFSNAIFTFTYCSIITFLLYIVQYPLLMHRAFTAFVVIFFVRAICIHFIALSPSPGILALRDPFSDFMASENSILNDLFFSGHVADLAFFAFIVYDRKLKLFFTISGIVVATLLVWQRVHYTLDVVAAPVFAYICYWVIVEKDAVWAAYLKKPVLEQKWEQ